jgi:hypothetical protein
MKVIVACTLVITLSGCAIEGIGFDGRVNAYKAASSDSNEYIVLHSGIRDAGWYEGWCDVLRPHFQRMTDEEARVNRYCAAMLAQPENAPKIAHALAGELSDSANGAQASGNNAVAGMIAVTQAQQAQRQVQQAQPIPLIATPAVSPTVNCRSYAVGNQVNTTCQ